MNPIEVKHNPSKHRFEVELGKQLAVLQYQKQGNRMVITHTEVPPAHEGQGIGSALARAMLEYARDHHLTVISFCSFVDAYMRRHPELTNSE